MGKTGRRGTGRYRWKFLSGTFTIMDFTFGLALVRDMNGGDEWIQGVKLRGGSIFSLIPLVAIWEIL